MRSVICLAMLMMIFEAKVAGAAEPSLTVDLGGVTRRFTTSELLARPDAAEIDVPNDHDYGRATRYRAVPLVPLLADLPQDRFDTLEARATDGFVAQIPLLLVRQGTEGGATPWIAVEPPGQPWPNLPSKDTGAGPFYLVWEHPDRSGVVPEQWPCQLASLTALESPAHRWPQLAADLPRDNQDENRIDQPCRVGVAQTMRRHPPLDACRGGSGGEAIRQHALVDRRVAVSIGE